ncbi:LysE/ArgO family amino acid transporter [Brevibacillus agri]|uniref:LysE/ArgO family amino acid transporter n=1 Tax=Brevibacillus TaxID=55080 RepID=UPI00040F4AC9|nr:MULTISPECIES: LysE/ArgO family amino acid transporter [Brevibacillus]MDT7986037.1 LysE/ArgO family amino acid transporter [Clostridium perfringens]MBY0050659.1 amino acid transporter [Brevibacillus agri]MCG5253766.1 LysE/ArgO family amino acid transporter [Brevibacillus agri]MDN4095974.1 LysE/ArgO family amino acid transporter [Brevibacillus agri]MDR9506286.1 LysE/ArgO family amino acid transporter [Brevibacillus agri]
MLEAILHGFVLAFGLILPLGAQNVFVFNQGAAQPTLWRAAPVVLTAAACDALLILLAVLGVSLVVLTVAWLKTVLYVIGVCFLLYMGYLTWRSRPSLDNGEKASFSAKKQMMFAASVSLLNPHAILDTIGVIGTSSLSYVGAEKWGFTIACILVSCLWFFGLSVAGRIMGKLDRSGSLLRSLNIVSALIMWGVAAYMASQLYFA